MIKAFEIRYDLPGSSGHRTIVLADNEEDAPVKLEKKDPSFKNIGGYYRVYSIQEKSLDAVLVSKLSATELLLLIGKE